MCLLEFRKKLFATFALLCIAWTGPAMAQAAPQSNKLIVGSVGPAPTVWLDMHRHLDVVYFLFDTTNTISRFDLATRTWLSDIALSNTPHAFHVDANGLFVAYGSSLVQHNLDGTNPVTIGTAGNTVRWIDAIGDVLYFQGFNQTVAYDLINDVELGTYGSSSPFMGIVTEPGRIYAIAEDFAPEQHLFLALNPDGTVASRTNSPFGEPRTTAQQLYLHPSGAYLIDNVGRFYNTADLSYHHSLAGAVDDVQFDGNDTIVLRDETYIRYDTNQLEVSSTAAPVGATRFVIHGGDLVTWVPTPAPKGVAGPLEATWKSLGFLTSQKSVATIDPKGLAYTPDAIAMDTTGTLYLLSSAHQQVFRWRADSGYLPSIALKWSPSQMTYHPGMDALILADTNGRMTTVDLAGPGEEQPFANAPFEPCGMAVAGDFLIICSYLTSGASHFLYDMAGLLTQWRGMGLAWEDFQWREDEGAFYQISNDNIMRVPVDGSGQLGTATVSDSFPARAPFGFSPDGSQIVSGRGAIINSQTFAIENALSNNIRGVSWQNDGFHTVRERDGGIEVQAWAGPSFAIVNRIAFAGTDPQMFHDGTQDIVIAMRNGMPHFTVLDDCALTGGIDQYYQDWPQVSVLDMMQTCSNVDF